MYRLLIFCLLLALATPARADLIAVNTLADTDADDGQCTLHEAIDSANFDVASGTMAGECAAGNGDDTIVFDVSGTVTLTDDLPLIREGVTIIGGGPAVLTLDGQDLYRLFIFDSAGGDQFFKVQGLSLTRGLTGGGTTAVVEVRSGDTLTLDFVRIFDNDLDSNGKGVLCDNGTLYMNWSTVESNGDGFGQERAVKLDNCDAVIKYSLITNNLNNGIEVRNNLPSGETRTVEVLHTTISNNTTNANGGGMVIFVAGGALGTMHVFVRHSTIVLNTSDNGGGISINGALNQLTLENSIVALNNDVSTPLDFPDLDLTANTGAVLTNGFNWIGDRTGDLVNAFPAGSPNINNDWVGTAAAPLDPSLTTLISNGGPMRVHLPTSTPISPLIDKGKCTGELHDQQGRGDALNTRRRFDLGSVINFPTSDGCDIGAAEAEALRLFITFNAQALLSGPYLGSGGMSTSLNPVLPSAQPYSTTPWNYFGIETNPSPDLMTDWVLLNLRTGAPLNPPMSDVVTGAAVMLEEGEIANADDESKPFNSRFMSVPVVPGMYYLEVDHRNHLSAMSRIPYAITPTAETIDMHTPGTVWGTNAVQDFGDGFVGLWGGDGDRSGGTTAFDFLNVWLPENGGPAGYTYGDFNLSSDVTAFDFLTVWLVANGQASQVP